MSIVHTGKGKTNITGSANQSHFEGVYVNIHCRAVDGTNNTEANGGRHWVLPISLNLNVESVECVEHVDFVPFKVRSA